MLIPPVDSKVLIKEEQENIVVIKEEQKEIIAVKDNNEDKVHFA